MTANKNTGKKRFRLLLLAVCCCVYCNLRAQSSNNELLVSKKDSTAIINELVTEQLTRQLNQCAGFQKLEQNKLKSLLKDSAATDSLSKLVLGQIGQLKLTMMGDGKTIAGNTFQNSKQLLRTQLSKVLQTEQVKGLFNQFTGFVQQPVLQWKGGSIKVNGQVSPSLLGTRTTIVNSNIISSRWAVMGIPMALQLLRQDLSGDAYYSKTNFSFQFDREAYLNSLRNRLKLKLKASELLPDYNDALQQMKANALNTLKLSLDSINQSYKGKLQDQLSQVGELQTLMKGDIRNLQDKLLSNEFLKNIEEKKNQLAQLQNSLNNGGTVNMALYDSLMQSVRSVEGINQILDKIKSFKDQAQQSGLLDKLQQAEQFKDDKLQEWMKDPDKLKAMAKDQLDLNGLQKMFLNMDQLKIGTNTINLSQLSLYQYTNNGINASFVNNKTYLFLMAGKQKEMGNLFDNRFSGSPIFSMDNASMGIRLGKGALTENYTHISLFSYKQGKSNYGNTVVENTPGSTVVATLSTQYAFNESNNLSLEISKSAHKYSNEQSIYDTLQQGSSLTKQLLAGESFVQQMAFTLQWDGELKEKNLSYNLHGTRIGKAYTNPGNMFLSRGLTEFGGGVKKSFFKNQLQLAAKGNFREYEYSDTGTRYRNYNFSFQGKWKFNKGQYVSIRYQPYQSLRFANNTSYNVGGSNRLTLDGSFKHRFGKINYQHTLSLSAIKNNYQFDTVPVNNNSVLLSSLQTVTIGKRSYYVNVQYNKANEASALAVFNTQFSADAGLMYNILKGITGSSALNYNSTKDWFKQIGIKQTLSGQIGERFIVSIYANLLQNIKEYKPNNMGSSRFDWSLQYLIK
ncbi:MAG: hypothetical protein QM726_17760 [Chitinophagaceae bacterium]